MASLKTPSIDGDRNLVGSALPKRNGCANWKKRTPA
jgi:hypothetical protein